MLAVLTVMPTGATGNVMLVMLAVGKGGSIVYCATRPRPPGDTPGDTAKVISNEPTHVYDTLTSALDAAPEPATEMVELAYHWPPVNVTPAGKTVLVSELVLNR